jgi:tRNA(fMet)-specific endonuclease VapC
VKYLLDSNIIIAAIMATDPHLYDHMAQCDEGDIATSAIAYGEVAHGSALGKPPPMAMLEQFFDVVDVLPFDREAGRACASLPFMRGSYDRLIAAHALSLGLTVVTANVRDFADIPGLKVENWTLPL